MFFGLGDVVIFFGKGGRGGGQKGFFYFFPFKFFTSIFFFPVYIKKLGPKFWYFF